MSWVFHDEATDLATERLIYAANCGKSTWQERNLGVFDMRQVVKAREMLRSPRDWDKMSDRQQRAMVDGIMQERAVRASVAEMERALNLDLRNTTALASVMRCE